MKPKFEFTAMFTNNLVNILNDLFTTRFTEGPTSKRLAATVEKIYEAGYAQAMIDVLARDVKDAEAETPRKKCLRCGSTNLLKQEVYEGRSKETQYSCQDCGCTWDFC